MSAAPQPVGACPRCGGSDLHHTDAWSVSLTTIEVEFTCQTCRLVFLESHLNECAHDSGTYVDGHSRRCQGCSAFVPALPRPVTSTPPAPSDTPTP